MENNHQLTKGLPVIRYNIKEFIKECHWTKVLILILMILIGGLMVALYLPLPSTQMMLASTVYDRSLHPVTTFYLQNREPVSIKEIPPFLKQAFLAVEDHRFYQHHGVNPGRILKAAWYDILHRRLAEGGSTITQQLARTLYLNRDRNFLRKSVELFYTFKLELHLTKDQILERYLNQIYFGHGAYGLKVAAATYFHKELSELNQAEMALLAGLPKGPAYYSPYEHPDAARQRLTAVLHRMMDCGYITAAEFRKYCGESLTLPGLREKQRPAPYFLARLQDEVAALFPQAPDYIFRAGLKIESTLDPNLQQLAEQSLTRGLPKLIHDSTGLIQPQGAMIVTDPANGAIRALVGGTDIKLSQFNRATQARRQPGSAFKPILYTVALENGFTLATRIDRTPKTYYLGAHTYRPLDNEMEQVSGNLSLRQALASSSNVIAVKLLEKLGVEQVIRIAAELGIASPLPRQLSLALGSGEITPLELLTAYLPLANGGYKYAPSTIRRILDSTGHVIFENKPQPQQVLDPGVAYLITQALTGVLQTGGTAANIGEILNRPAAGKTGTTEANRDAWFVGYTPDLLAVVYVGCDHNERSLPGAANRVAAPIWADFFARALAGKPARDFEIPSNIKVSTVCSETGLLATTFCPGVAEYFLAGTEPTEYCFKHRFIDLEICKRSGLLPGPYCREREMRRFPLGEQPAAVCEICKKQMHIIDWLWYLFRRDEQQNRQPGNQPGIKAP